MKSFKELYTDVEIYVSLFLFYPMFMEKNIIVWVKNM